MSTAELRRERGETERMEGNRAVEREILEAIAEIRYGSIEIVIQDSRVVQIERREKVRFDGGGKAR